MTLVQSGEADVMTLDKGEHFAIRFQDRALGDAARKVFLDEFCRDD